MSGPFSFHVAIPARVGSTRLHGKALAMLQGKPMLQWVHERACASGARDVLIATDDPGIVAAARGFGAEARMTAAHHASGTDRIAELAAIEHWPDSDIVVNLQGDEPLMPPALIRQCAMLLASNPDAAIATLATPVASLEEFLDPNAVKVVADRSGKALYFSRAPIPWNRDGAPVGLASQSEFAGARRHVGIYAYRVAALRRLASLQPTALEKREKLEQLRALEHAFLIQVADATERPGPDVNTAEDLERVAALLRSSTPADEAQSVDALYGLEPVIEPGERAGQGGHGIQPASVQCPYCGETFETTIDLSAGSASYIEDCQVCCRPIELTLEVDAGGDLVSLIPGRGD